MISRSVLREMILSEVAQAQNEVAARKPARLTRERIREIVLEEAAAIRSARPVSHGGDMMITSKLSLVEALMGDMDEAGPGIILSDPKTDKHVEGSMCEQCGSMYESPVAKCQQCGAKMEYVARGLTGMGKTAGVYEAKKKGGLPKTPEAAKRMVDRLAKDPGPTWGDVTQYAKGWGAENPEAYAATLLRMSGGIPGKNKKKHKTLSEADNGSGTNGSGANSAPNKSITSVVDDLFKKLPAKKPAAPVPSRPEGTTAFDAAKRERLKQQLALITKKLSQTYEWYKSTVFPQVEAGDNTPIDPMRHRLVVPVFIGEAGDVMDPLRVSDMGLKEEMRAGTLVWDPNESVYLRSGTEYDMKFLETMYRNLEEVVLTLNLPVNMQSFP